MNRRAITGIATTAVFAGLAVVYSFPPTQYSFYPRCPIYLTTHWLCPGCGSTRALHELLHRNVAGAFHFNAMFTVLSPLVFGWLAFCCYRVMRYDRFPDFAMPRPLVAGLAVVVVLFTVARNTFFAF